MEPSLRDGDVLWVRPFGPSARPPARGALVVVRDPERPQRWLVKRLVAIGGDRLLVGPTTVRRRPAGAAPLERPPFGAERFLEEIVVPDGHGFVLSDRPEVGRDSRQFGSVPAAAIIGVARKRPSRRPANAPRPRRPVA